MSEAEPFELFIGGTGGQGVLLMAQLVSESAVGKYPFITYFPNYAPAQRGMECEATVVLSNDEIPSMIIWRPNVAVAMTDNYSSSMSRRLLPGGSLLLDSTICKDWEKRDDLTIHSLPATEIAVELGGKQSSNMVLLGALLKITGILSVEAVTQTLESKPTRHRDLSRTNKLAILKGAELV